MMCAPYRLMPVHIALLHAGRQCLARTSDVCCCLRCRWLEDAITEWQTSQGHLVLFGEAGGAHYTFQQVEEVKMVLRLLPIFWVTVMYW